MQGPDHIGETRLRVRYAETDKMGVVYHSNFFVWFEVGRVELLRQLGFEYRRMEQEDDCHIAVVDLRCRYKAPARYDDLILIRTHIRQLRGPMLQFQYEVLRENGVPSKSAVDLLGCEKPETLLAEGESTHIVVNSKFEKTTLPRKYVEAFQKALKLP